MTAAGLPLSDPAVAWYDEDGDDPVMAAGFACPESSVGHEGVEIAELPAYDRAVCLLHSGSMESVGATWQELHEHIEAQGARPSGPRRET